MPERPYIPGKDDPAILALRTKVWGADHPHTNADFLKWLFQDTPGGPGTGIVSEQGDKIIGFAGLSRRTGQLGATPLRIAHGLEFMVDPEVSGVLSGRVGVRLLNEQLKLVRDLGYDCNLNYPNDNSRRMLTSKRVNYVPVYEPDLYVRPLPGYTVSAQEHPSVAKRLIMTTGGRMASVYTRIRSVGSSRGAQIDRITHFDDRFDDFWHRLQADGFLRFTRKAETLNWRYAGHPLYDYTTLTATVAGDLAGYIVISPRHVMGTNALLICDLNATDNAAPVREALLNAAITEARAQNASAIVTLCNDHDPARASLSRCGFLKVPPKLNPKPFRMIAHSNSEIGAKALIGAAWSFTWGDMDVV